MCRGGECWGFLPSVTGGIHWRKGRRKRFCGVRGFGGGGEKVLDGWDYGAAIRDKALSINHPAFEELRDVSKGAASGA